MSAKQTNLLQGTLDLLILKALGSAELHGLGISRRIEQITQGTFLVKPGSLFPALHRMEEAGWLSSFWGESENNRRAKFYRLTKAGKAQVEVETRQWRRVAVAMTNALRAT
jgi:PadR family transcriptional regulator, regulatory protein PadR